MPVRNILLTGASSGFGRAIAARLAADGHRVFAGMRDIEGRNAGAAHELSAIPAACAIVPVALDVTDDASVAQAVGDVLDRADHVDVLINCAGVMWTGTTEAFSIAQFERLLQTNVLGPFRLLRAVLPGMRARGAGLLVTVTSTCGRFVPPNFGIYAASKFALEALAESIAYETADLGIRSLIIEPGAFDTGLMGNQMPPAGRDVVAAYGEIGQFDRVLAERTRDAMRRQPELHDPQLVADVVARAVAAGASPSGLRQPVGRTGDVPSINAHLAAAQATFLANLGLAHLADHEGTRS